MPCDVQGLCLYPRVHREETVDLDEGDQVMMRYSLVQHLLQEGSVELM